MTHMILLVGDKVIVSFPEANLLHRRPNHDVQRCPDVTSESSEVRLESRRIVYR